MFRTTQKMLKNLVKNNIATDITNFNFDQINALRKSHSLDAIAISHGVYGMNGALFKDECGNQYAICGRSSALFQLV